jgi:hypothetical protein
MKEINQDYHLKGKNGIKRDDMRNVFWNKFKK